MTRFGDINNRIEGHRILSDVEVSIDGAILPLDECMNMNQGKYKRLGIRKIKFMISDNPGYPFLITIVGVIEVMCILICVL
jgi:hypothetical protein